MEPPTEWEIKRNNEVASRWHHNRNPFVDHPEYASKIFYTLSEPDSSTPTAAVKNAIETYGDLNQGIVLEHSTSTLNEGQNTKINVVNNPNSESITWSSDNTNVATVDNLGNVSAINAGTANSEDDVLISSMIERYVVIITNYGYENFLVDDLGAPFLSPLIDDRRIDIYPCFDYRCFNNRYCGFWVRHFLPSKTPQFSTLR